MNDTLTHLHFVYVPLSRSARLLAFWQIPSEIFISSSKMKWSKLPPQSQLSYPKLHKQRNDLLRVRWWICFKIMSFPTNKRMKKNKRCHTQTKSKYPQILSLKKREEEGRREKLQSGKQRESPDPLLMLLCSSSKHPNPKLWRPALNSALPKFPHMHRVYGENWATKKRKSTEVSTESIVRRIN